MSFILDALKKSEAKRRAQSGPEWSVSQTLTPPEKSSGLTRGRIFLLGTLGLLVLGLSAAVLWQRPGLIPSAEQPLAAAANPQVGGSGQAPSASPTLAESTPVAQTDPLPNQPERGVSAENPVAQVEPVESQQPSPTVSEEEVSAGGDGDALAVELSQGNEASASDGEASDVAVVMAIEEAIVNAQTPAESAPEPAEQEAEAAWQPAAPDYLYQWELPLAVRQALPELKLTIHVFASNPADRFVLINGVRFTEGAELGSGAVLAEIRTEGALVDFRDYRFLLTR